MAGSLVKIDEEIVSSAVASVTLTGIDSTYDVYMSQVINATPDTDATTLRYRFTVSGTADSSANYDKAFKNLRSDSAFSAINEQNVTYLHLGGVGTDTQEVVNSTQYLFNFNNASEYSFTTYEGIYIQSTGLARGFQGGGVLKETQITDGVNYFMESGNIASGTFTLYGLKK